MAVAGGTFVAAAREVAKLVGAYLPDRVEMSSDPDEAMAGLVEAAPRIMAKLARTLAHARDPHCSGSTVPREVARLTGADLPGKFEVGGDAKKVSWHRRRRASHLGALLQAMMSHGSGSDGHRLTPLRLSTSCHARES